MKLMTIKKTDLARALEKIRKSYSLTGPVKDKDGYVFRPLQKGELPDLDYDMTRLSPKAVVFPQTESLFALSYEQGDKTKRVLEETVSHDLPGAVVGIRPYDAKALHLLKLNFDTPEFKDPYFIRKFEALTLVGLAENHPGPANFSTSCGTGPFDETYLDILLMDTGDEYTGKILTPKGEAFAACAGWTPAEAPGLEEKLSEMKSQAEAEIESRIDFSHIREAGIQALYDAPFWKDLAFACINCSTCTFACPTCWCFDIQDETGKDKGVRLRLWDSCMADLYSAHASGHNPRSEGWQRFRNRFMHKLKYFTDKYQEGIMCVGCGRCISLCPAHIDIRKICRHPEPEGGLLMINPYRPYPVRIDHIQTETTDKSLKTFTFVFTDKADEAAFAYTPGQFAMLSVPGVGEIPIGIASSPTEKGIVKFTVFKTGKVTSHLHNMKEGDDMGIRGPFGNGFPIKEMENRDILIIGGGFAFTTLRSTIKMMLEPENRRRFKNIDVVYGARNPGMLLYREELEAWEKREDIFMHITVDGTDDAYWPYHTGFVPAITQKCAPKKSRDAKALVCGPPVMIKFTKPVLTDLGYPDADILMSLENRMKCGIGMCGRCNIGKELVCKDGPVFTLEALNQTPGEF